MSFLVRFASAGAKAAFLEKLGEAAPALLDRVRASRSQAEVVTITESSAEEDELIRTLLDDQATTYGDVQMRTF
ncbi:MAG TPA: hypothetical protein VD846_01795 [Allosphingosinicella sp.]|nr:hypothetical protein [Allosphingosinicella sp.]